MDIRGKLGEQPGRQGHQDPQEDDLLKSSSNTKLLFGLKVTAWITFWTSKYIRGKLGEVPGELPHLGPQDDVLEKCL